MAKKKAGSNRPVATNSVASKASITAKSVKHAAQTTTSTTPQVKKSNPSLVNAKTVKIVEEMAEASTQDRVALLKVEAEMKKEEAKRDAYYGDALIPTFKMSDDMEFEMIECLRQLYHKDQWKVSLSSQVEQVQLETASLSVHQQNSIVLQKHTIIYYTLEKMGFNQRMIQDVMWETCGSSLQACLNYALLFLDPQHLPVGLTDKHVHGSASQSITLVSGGPLPSSPATMQTSTRHASLPQEITQQSAPRNNHKLENSLKSWILNRAAETSEDELEEEKPLEPVIPTNLHYAQLKLQQEDFKEAIKGAKEQDDQEQVSKMQTQLHDIKSKMDQVSKNKDFNPKTANLEFKRLMEEKNELGGKSKKKKTEATPQDSGDLFGDMFSESNNAHSKPSSSSSLCKIRDMSYAGWTGKSPKQYFNDYLSKNAKGTKLTFQPLPDKSSGFRLKAILKGGPKAFDGQEAEMNQDERVGNIREAEHFAATKLMYKLMADRPIHTLLPPPYRDLWLEMKTAEKMMDKIEVANENEERIQFLVKLKDRALAAMSNSTSNSTSSLKDTLMESQKSKESSKFELKPNAAVSASISKEFHRRQQTTTYQTLLNQRSQLPVFQHRQDILEAIQNHRVVIISGDTGSGKSTQIPQFILEHAIEKQSSAECHIVCTQPRRISAMSIASRVSEEMGDKTVGELGSLVGYQIRLESKVSKSTKLVFATTGVLLRRLESDPDLKSVSHIIVDEVHERSLDSDFLLLLLRRLLARRSDFRVVLMSATAEAEKFAAYFATYLSPNTPHQQVCPWISVPGRTFPVNTFYLEDAVESCGYVLEQDSEFSKKRNNRKEAGFVNVTGRGGNTFRMKLEWDESDDSLDEADAGTDVDVDYGQYSATTLKALKWMDPNKLNTDLIYQLVGFIHEHGPADTSDNLGSILIFLPGLAEIKKVHDVLTSSSRKALDGLLVLPLHSVLGSKEQGKGNQMKQDVIQVFLPAPANMRKVVLATNIAETGITIPDIVYVIDTCRAREIGYDNRRHITRLTEVYVSKANCKQRRGRAGRVKEGICYHLIPRKAFDVLMDHRPPEIVRLPLEELCLRIRASGFEEPVIEFLSECIDTPPEKNILRSVEELVKIQAFDANEKLTPLGLKLADIPVDVRLGKMLLYGAAMECLDPILTAAAALSLGRSPFARPFGKETEAKQAHEYFKTGDSDILTCVNAFEQWRSKIVPAGSLEAARNFCHKHYLSFQNMTLIEEARGQLLNLLMGVDVVDRDVIDKQANKSYIQTMLKEKYTKYGKTLSIVSAAMCAGLYPNVLIARIDTTPEGLTPKQPLFQLSSPGSLEIIRLHSAKSMYSSGPELKKPVWFAYHAMTRISGAQGSGQLKVWDVTKVGFLPVIALAGTTGRVEHRQGILSLENDTIKIKCCPRTAVAVELFTRYIRTRLDARIMNCTEKDTLLPLYYKLLELEWKTWE